MAFRLISILVLCSVFLKSDATISFTSPRRATASVSGNGISGTITFDENSEPDPLTITGSLTGLSNNAQQSFQIRDNGCGNLANLGNQIADLGDISTSATGTGTVTVSTNAASLFGTNPISGKSFVIYNNAAGTTAVACGTITLQDTNNNIIPVGLSATLGILLLLGALGLGLYLLAEDSYYDYGTGYGYGHSGTGTGYGYDSYDYHKRRRAGQNRPGRPVQQPVEDVLTRTVLEAADKYSKFYSS